MKYRLMMLEICCLFLFYMNMHGQYRNDSAVQNNGCTLTGNFQYDLSMNINSGSNADSSVDTRPVVYKRLYSPVRAGLFSAFIPGAGQLYTKSYWQSAAFFGAEVLMWVLYATNEKKGNDQTNLFQNYADAETGWSVVRYAGWINANFGQAIPIDPNQSLQPWQRVSWSELNAAEDVVGSLAQPTGFSHKLAPHGDQQYYEMIGKYAQFGGGWSDAGGYTKEDVLGNNGIGNVTPQFLAYSKMRGDANNFYNIATTVSYVIVANHVLSALEAVWNASRLNHRIKLQTHIESRQIYGNVVEFVPTLHVEYEL
jgi:Family of unknown function (DUF5683)